MAVSAQNDVRGLRYIDDLVLNRQDSNADGDYIDSGDFTHYALTDHQFSVVALIDSAGNLIERISYTPYGEARHHWRQDVDGDGDIDATDQSLVTNALNNRIYQPDYNVDADFNRDGLIDSNDSRQIGSGAFRAALPAGWISSLTTGNVVGFSGYVFNREIDAGGLYTVRFRHYDPVWGRWISRDPAGYMDSMSLYGYGFGSPLWGSDPFGLGWWDDYWYYFKEGAKGVWEYWVEDTPTPSEWWDDITSTDRETVHELLDVAGLIPIVGAFFDVINGVLYVFYGEWGLAGLAVIAILPGGDVIVVSGKAGRRLAKEHARVARSATPIRQGTYGNGPNKTRWWEYEDVDGKRKIIVEHPDGSIHPGVPKPQSCHGDGSGPPKYWPVPGAPPHIIPKAH